MRISLACLVALCALPAGVMAQDASVHDKPAVRGSIIANLLQDHDNPFLLSTLMRATICSIRGPATSIKRRSAAMTGPKMPVKMEVKFQLSPGVPRCGAVSWAIIRCWARPYAQKSWWQLSNSKESGAVSRKPIMNPSCFWALRPTTSLPAGRCAISRWGITTTRMGVPTPPRAAGIGFMPA